MRLVDLPVAERVFGKDRPDFMQLRLDDMFASAAVAEDIPRRLGEEYATQDWAQMNRSLFSALWLEKMAISITIGLIIMVAALNIVASLVLLVMEKSRDIAILKTMGSSAASIRRIFMLQGLIIGLIGTARRHAARVRGDLRARPLPADPRADRRLSDFLRARSRCCRRISSPSSPRRC